MAHYRLGIDVGGTFTDLLAFDEQSGALLRYKVSSHPRAPEAGVLEAIRALQQDYPDAHLSLVTHSTTLATNALLGQLHLTLPRLALITTAGFRDVLEIGRQGRAEVYNLFVRRPTPLVERQDRFGIRERIDASGAEIEPLDEHQLREIAQELLRRGINDCAICFLHAYKNAAHERRARDVLLEEAPNLAVTLSSEIDPQEREYERASTTVVSALLAPIVQRYLHHLETALEAQHTPLFIMQSHGGMASVGSVTERPATIIESGPASGVMGAAHLGKLLGIERLLSFDMGGTTAKAGTILHGTPQVIGEFEASGRTHSGRAIRGSGYPVRFPFIDLAEVSAGGGTIAWIDSAGALRVGPNSAGADPGPACYGKGNLEPTITDANLALGRLNPGQIAGGAVQLRLDLAGEALDRLAARLTGFDRTRLAAGIIRLVNADMAKVLRIVSLERGHDPRQFTLVAFGGAGPLHACALAAELAIPRIIVPPHPGLFSAWGLLVSDQVHTTLQSLLMLAHECEPAALEHVYTKLEAESGQALSTESNHTGAIAFRRNLELRYAGQSFELTVPVPPVLNKEAFQETLEAFHTEHARVYGYAARDIPVELVTARVDAIAQLPKPSLPEEQLDQPSPPAEATAGERRVFFEEPADFLQTPMYQRERLRAGNLVHGPAIIEQYDTTTLLPPGWRATVDRFTNLIIERA
jgi:N-methylhydantoinase A